MWKVSWFYEKAHNIANFGSYATILYTDVTCIFLQDRWTALHWAASRGHVQVVETLIRLGADVNALDKVS